MCVHHACTQLVFMHIRAHSRTHTHKLLCMMRESVCVRVGECVRMCMRACVYVHVYVCVRPEV